MSDPKANQPPQEPLDLGEIGAEQIPDASAEIAESSAHVAALQAEMHDLKDRYLRAVAEAENVRKRGEKERVEAGQFAIQRFARDLLEVADNFRRALEAISEETRKGLPASVGGVLTGIEATEALMLAVFERHQLKRLNPKGERFDPHLHQAIAEAPHPETPEGHIFEVAQTGFTLAGRLIRPAMVIVSRGVPHHEPQGKPNGKGDLGEKFDRKV
jgi:molecular chaperone GrpE